jgi:Leucine-rich repeat (LRR) protein
LTGICLQSNKITSFNTKSLIGLSKLKKLCLSFNPIKDLFPLQLVNICSMNPGCLAYDCVC